MKQSDMLLLMQRIACFYPKFEVTDEKMKAWYSLFENYDRDTMEQAINEYAGGSRYAPLPKDIKEAYWQIQNDRKAERAKVLMREAKENGCRYCGGSGWFRTLVDDIYGSFLCACKCQGDPTNLNKALASPDYEWSDEQKAFVPRRDWVGDEKPRNQPISAGQMNLDFTACIKTL